MVNKCSKPRQEIKGAQTTGIAVQLSGWFWMHSEGRTNKSPESLDV